MLIEIGRHLHDGGAALRGVMTHAGSSYELDTPDALRRLAEQERAAACAPPSGCARRACRARGQRRLDADRAVGKRPRRRHRGAGRRLRVLRPRDGQRRRLPPRQTSRCRC